MINDTNQIQLTVRLEEIKELSDLDKLESASDMQRSLEKIHEIVKEVLGKYGKDRLQINQL